MGVAQGPESLSTVFTGWQLGHEPVFTWDAGPEGGALACKATLPSTQMELFKSSSSQIQRTTEIYYITEF